MEDKKPLEYIVRIVRSNEYGLYLEAVPNQWAARPNASIDLPAPLQHTPRVEINWSSGAMRYTVDTARLFFKAGLELCDRVEQICIEKGIDPNA